MALRDFSQDRKRCPAFIRALVLTDILPHLSLSRSIAHALSCGPLRSPSLSPHPTSLPLASFPVHGSITRDHDQLFAAAPSMGSRSTGSLQQLPTVRLRDNQTPEHKRAVTEWVSGLRVLSLLPLLLFSPSSDELSFLLFLRHVHRHAIFVRGIRM
jgi:hypothetical protein